VLENAYSCLRSVGSNVHDKRLMKRISIKLHNKAKSLRKHNLWLAIIAPAKNLILAAKILILPANFLT